MAPRKKGITIVPEVSDVYTRTSQVIITTTEDKLRLCLTENFKKTEKRKSWVAPFGIFATILVTLLTSDFNDAVLPAGTWQAIFCLSAIITFVWFVYSAYHGIKSVKIEDIIRELKEKY